MPAVTTHSSSSVHTATSGDDEQASVNDQSRDVVIEAQLAQPNNVVVKDEMIPDSSHIDEDEGMPFDPERYFDGEPSQDASALEDFKPPDQAIRAIIDQQDIQVLEAGVAQSMLLLQRLKQSFSQHNTQQDAEAWIEAIEKLIPQAERKRTIVGVVGNTGAGKSSVINAMLDEERLVPTNCMVSFSIDYWWHLLTSLLTASLYCCGHRNELERQHGSVQKVSRSDRVYIAWRLAEGTHDADEGYPHRDRWHFPGHSGRE
jgi:hypothetical protein